MNDGARVNKARLEGVHRQTVPFHDCDPLGIVWHGHYYKYLEIARERLFERVGLTLPFFKERGLYMVVIESRCRHAFPLRTGDELEVRAWFKDIEQRLFIGYEVRNLTQHRRSARAWTSLVTMRGDEMLMETPREIVGEIVREIAKETAAEETAAETAETGVDHASGA